MTHATMARQIGASRAGALHGFSATLPGRAARCGIASFVAMATALATLSTVLSSESVWWIGRVATLVVLGFGTVGLGIQALVGSALPTWRRTGIGFAWFILLAAYVLGLGKGISPEMYVRFGQLALVMCFFAFVSSARWDPQLVRWFAGAFVVSLVVAWTVVESVAPVPEGFLPTSGGSVGMNSLLGAIVCVLGFLASSSRLARWFFAFVGVLLSVVLVFSFTRSCWLGALVFLSAYVFYGLMLRWRAGYTLCFVLAVAAMSWFVYLTVEDYVRGHSQLEETFGDLSRSVTGKRVATREQVWGAAIMEVRRNPMTGAGLGRSLEQLVGLKKSAHSVYLELGLQTGILGIVGGLLLFYLIGLAFSGAHREHRFARIGCASLLALVVQGLFEGALFQGNLGIGIIAWIVLGAALSLHWQGEHQSGASR